MWGENPWWWYLGNLSHASAIVDRDYELRVARCVVHGAEGTISLNGRRRRSKGIVGI
jgi:hypothetical protein